MKERKLPRHSKILPRIHFCSIKNDASRFCDSELEVARLLQLEFDDDVTAYNTQPQSFSYLSDNRLKRYTPDNIILKRDNSINFEEVKELSKARNDKNERKFATLKNLFLNSCGHELNIVTDDEIQHQYRIANYKKMYPFLAFDLSENCRKQLVDLPNSLTYSQLIDIAENNNWHAYDPLIVLANKIYNYDLAILLGPDTRLEKNDDISANF